ncbi:hypothetical protein O0L34_g14788 [Tuta absoluta]|nr:hypothetical protein O0L34_g14788 [Tuta absoluta]
METIKASQESLATLVTNQLKNFEQKLHITPQQDPTATSLAKQFADFKSFILESLTSIQRQIDLLGLEQDRMEMRSRRKFLLLHGVNEVENEDVINTAVEIVSNSLTIPIAVDNFSRVQRLGRPTENKPRPLLLKLKDVALRDKI